MSDRFSVEYQVSGSPDEARALAEYICLEETLEMPEELLPHLLSAERSEAIRGHVEHVEMVGPDTASAHISYPNDTSAFELTQLMNVIFGNISMRPGVRVQRLQLPTSLTEHFHGPRFGGEGVRTAAQVGARPLMLGALKPMGLSPSEFADMTYKLALGGVDYIKDDHGLSNQRYAPFQERVQRCVEAVQRANRQTGFHCAYVANISAPADEIVARGCFAKAHGAGGVMLVAGATGFDAIRLVADDDAIALPIVLHPALLGQFFTDPRGGISPVVLFAQLARLAGVDISIFPSFGGRFPITREECVEVAGAMREPLGALKPTLPAPGGSTSLDRLPQLTETYGRDVMYVMGRGLYLNGFDLTANGLAFRALLEK